MPIKLIRLQTPNIKFALGGDWQGDISYYFAIYQKVDAQIRKIGNNKIRVSTGVPGAFADFDVGDYVRFTFPGSPFNGVYSHYFGCLNTPTPNSPAETADIIEEISSDYSEIVLKLYSTRYNSIPPPPSGESYIEVDFSISYYGDFAKTFLQADIHGADRQYNIPPIQNAFTYEYICNYPPNFDVCNNTNPLIPSTDNNFAPPLNKPTHRGLLLNGSKVEVVEKGWSTFLNDDFFYHGVNLSNITFFITPQSQEQTYYHLANAPEVRFKIGFQKTTSQKILWVEDIFPSEAGWYNELPDGSTIPVTPAVSFSYGTNSSNRPFLTNDPQSVTINPITNISKLRIVRKPFDRIRIEENSFDVDINNSTETFSLPTYLLYPNTDANTEFYVYLLGTYNSKPFSHLVHEGVLATPPPPPSPIDVPFCVYMALSNPCTLTPSIPESTALAIPQPNYNVADAIEFIQKYTTNYPDRYPNLPAEPLYYILSPRDLSNAVKPGRVRQDFYVQGFYATSFESGYDMLLPSRVPMPLNRPCPFAPYLNERNETIAGRDSLLIPLAPLLGENEIAPTIPQDPHISPANNSYIKGFGIGEYNGIVFQEWYNFQTFTAYNSGASIKGFGFQILAGSPVYPGDVIELKLERVPNSNPIPEEYSFILFYIVVFEKQSGQIFYHNWAVRQLGVPYIQDYDNAPDAIVIYYLHKEEYKLHIQISAPPPGDYVAVAGVRIYEFPVTIPNSRQLWQHENKRLEFTVHKKVAVSIPTFSASQTCCSNFYYHSREITLASFQNTFVIDGYSQPSQTSINTPDPNTKLYLLNYQASDDACWDWMGLEIQLTPANDTSMLQIDAYLSKKVNDFQFNLAPQLISFDILGKVLNEEVEMESEYLLLSSNDKYLKNLQRNVKVRIRISATNLYLKWLIQEFCLFADYWEITELNSNRKNPLVQTKFLPPKSIRWIETSTGFAAEVELESLQTTTANKC